MSPLSHASHPPSREHGLTSGASFALASFLMGERMRAGRKTSARHARHLFLWGSTTPGTWAEYSIRKRSPWVRSGPDPV
jgi:hypothetical protein